MIDATDIEISVENGGVTLRGYVDRREPNGSPDIAESVFGVKDVSNQVESTWKRLGRR
jgi:osmotically-inducible protein OsmY